MKAGIEGVVALGIVANFAGVHELGQLHPVRPSWGPPPVRVPVADELVAGAGFDVLADSLPLAAHPVSNVGIAVLVRHRALAVALAETERAGVCVIKVIDLRALAVRNTMQDITFVVLLTEVVEDDLAGEMGGEVRRQIVVLKVAGWISEFAFCEEDVFFGIGQCLLDDENGDIVAEIAVIEDCGAVGIDLEMLVFALCTKQKTEYEE